ncbi:MAG: transcription termination/antitermination protein NusA [Deltaproteobacteria bacterium]|nr:transcription termination/antitermination protein NusA [Deltaproteobacteria bacterium]
MLSNLKRIIDQVSRDKGIDRNLLIEGLEEAVMSAAKKKFGVRREMEAQFNEEFGEIELFQFRQVVEEVEDEQTQIALKDARLLDPEVELSDELGSKMEDVADLGRIAAQSAKQVIIQKMKDAEREVVYEMFKDRKGEIVNGIVQRFERGNIIVNLGRTDAILPRKEQMPRRSYRQGDRVRAMLLDVRQTARESQLILSRVSRDFITKLFTLEVPEMSEGIVSILAVARDSGNRSKIAVVSSESDVDPVGACVGMKGSRVQNVVQELQGERIDIVPWSPDPAKYVSNALAPAEVSMVVVDEDRKTLQVVVANDQLSLAIGRGGQNVRLASELLGWRIDVKSEEKYAKMMEDGFQSLVAIDGINNKIADILYENDIGSAAELAEAVPVDITAIFPDLDLEAAEKMVAAAGVAVLKSGEEKSANDSSAAAPGPQSSAPGAVEAAASGDDSAQPEVETK